MKKFLESNKKKNFFHLVETCQKKWGGPVLGDCLYSNAVQQSYVLSYLGYKPIRVPQDLFLCSSSTGLPFEIQPVFESGLVEIWFQIVLSLGRMSLL